VESAGPLRGSPCWCLPHARRPPVGQKDPPTATSVPALPQPLTKESIRELVARLSDDDVRKLLLDQLDRAAVAPASAKSAMGMSGMMDEHAGAMRTTLGSLAAAYYALPDALRQVGTKLTEPDGIGQLLVIAELLAALLVAGFGIEWVYHRALRRFRTRLEQTPAPTFSARAFQLGVGFLIDLGGILVWSIAAITAFFLLWHDHELRRTTILDLLIGVIIVRTTMLLARFCSRRATRQDDCCPLRTSQRARCTGSPSCSPSSLRSRSRW